VGGLMILNVFDLKKIVGEARVILDIGCNDGEHTNLFLKLFPGATIHAFEPDERAIRRFKENVKSDLVHLHEIAIGDCDGETTFYKSGGMPKKCRLKLPEGWDLSGSIMKPKNHLKKHPWCTFEDGGKIQVKSLDTWARENNIDKIDLIWADVQGAELQLILGGAKTLLKTRWLYTEYSNDEMYEGQLQLDTLADIMQMGLHFDVETIYDNDVLFRNTQL
jgi:2-O-methyltransferase